MENCAFLIAMVLVAPVNADNCREYLMASAMMDVAELLEVQGKPNTGVALMLEGLERRQKAVDAILANLDDDKSSTTLELLDALLVDLEGTFIAIESWTGGDSSDPEYKAMSDELQAATTAILELCEMALAHVCR